MPKDYKHAPRQKDKRKGSTLGGILTFITGLGLGLVVAVFLYLNQTDSGYIPFMSTDDATPPVQQPTEAPAPQTATVEPQQVPEPKFDFYNILPNKELNISEWVAEEESIPETTNVDDNSVYILQVGSFRQLDAADQVKAELALLGISADIQRVVINGQDTRYRVRIGPYEDQTKLNEERRRLQQNNLEYMLLKLQADDPRSGEG